MLVMCRNILKSAKMLISCEVTNDVTCEERKGAFNFGSNFEAYTM